MRREPFSSNILNDGSILYTKIHGMKAVVGANGSHTFQFQIPYSKAYFQGAEVLIDVLCQTNFTVSHPDPAVGVLEQYGYDVCAGKIIYQKTMEYAAIIPQGLIVTCTVENTEPTEQEFGVNFIMHEGRDPVPEAVE